MVCREADAEWLDQPLNGPDRTQRAAYVLEEEEAAGGSQYARYFGDGSLRIGDRAEPERAPTVSKLASANWSVCASPKSRSACRPSSRARRRPIASICSLSSMP